MSRFTKLAPALLTAVAGAVAVRRSQRGWDHVIPATSTPVDHTSRAVLAGPRPSAPAPPGVDAGPPPKEEEPIPTQTGEGPGPDSPLELPAPDWKASVKRAVKEFKEDRGTLTAAGMAFYWFLSIFPRHAAGAGMLGLVNVSQGTIDQHHRVDHAAPCPASGRPPGRSGHEGGRRLGRRRPGRPVRCGPGPVERLVRHVSACRWASTSPTTSTTTASSSRSGWSPSRSCWPCWCSAGSPPRCIVFGAPLGDALRDNLPFGSAFVVLWTVIRWVGGLAALTGLFATIYYLAPNRDTPRWVWVSPGGILAAVIWLAASVGFSVYVSQFGNYDETYGPLAGVVVLLLWLYLTALAVVLGGELNAELERQSAARKGQVPSQPQ